MQGNIVKLANRHQRPKNLNFKPKGTVRVRDVYISGKRQNKIIESVTYQNGV